MRQLTVNPFVSEAQRAWMFANEPDMAKRWAKHTSKNKILPRRKHPVTNGRVARLDPSRTITLRRQFQADLVRRFNELRRAIVQLVLHEDAFGLKQRSTLVFHAQDDQGREGNWITVKGRHIFIPEGEDAGEAIREHCSPNITNTATANTRWQFHSTEQKLTAFGEWIKRQIQLHIIGEHLDENAWWNRYVMDGFKRGAGRAFDDTRPQVREWQDSPEARQRLDFYNGTREEFLRSSFNWPASREKVKLLASRAFTDLKGVTDSMAARISHTLVDGLTKGDNPRVIARELAKNVNLGKVRAQTIARTEIIRTHAEGQLDAFKKMGVTEVGVMAEWATAEDSRVCKLCQPLDGVVLKVDEARGLLPRHPNCRCCWLPANLGEDESDQKRGKPAIEQAIRESYGKEDQDKSSWGGADKTISKARPVGVFNSDVMVAVLDRLDRIAGKLDVVLNRQAAGGVLNAFCPTGEGGGVDPKR